MIVWAAQCPTRPSPITTAKSPGCIDVIEPQLYPTCVNTKPLTATGSRCGGIFHTCERCVTAGETCPPPTNAIRVTFDRGVGLWTVNVKNEAGIGGRCTYRATSTTGLTGASRDFDIAPNGTASFSVPAPLPLTTYQVVTSCTGEYDGKQVEFGRDVQTVSL